MKYVWTALKIGFVVFFAAFLFQCTPLGDQEVSGRFKIVVEVTTPEGLKTGAGVVEHRLLKPSWDFTRFTGKIFGDAIPIDLGGRGKLFFTLAEAGYVWSGKIDDRWGVPYLGMEKEYQKLGLLPPSEKMKTCWWLDKLLCRFEAVSRMRKPVPLTTWPLFVRFLDLSKPETIEAIDPKKLAAAFGEGVEFRSVTIVPTDDPVTRGTLGDLTWLPPMLAKSGSTRLDRQRGDLTTRPFDPLHHIFKAKYLSSGNEGT